MLVTLHLGIGEFKTIIHNRHPEPGPELDPEFISGQSSDDTFRIQHDRELGVRILITDYGGNLGIEESIEFVIWVA